MTYGAIGRSDAVPGAVRVGHRSRTRRTRRWGSRTGRCLIAATSLIAFGGIATFYDQPAVADNNPGGGTVTSPNPNEICLTNNTGQSGCFERVTGGAKWIYSGYPAKASGVYTEQDFYQPNPPNSSTVVVNISGPGGVPFSKFVSLPNGLYEVGIEVCDPTGPSCDNWTGQVFLSMTNPPPNDCSFVDNTVGITAVHINGAKGYLRADAAGQVCASGAAKWYGDLVGKRLSAPIIFIAATTDGKGYWLLGADGGIFTFGDAHFFGSTGNVHLNAPVVGMAPTLDNRGYWLVAKDGGIFTFGDARFFGSTGNIRLNQPVDGMAVAPHGSGYWLVASDGGVFTFTRDGFFGSLGNVRLAKPIVGMSGTPDGRGYTLVGSDGGVFTFGDAPFYGSLGKSPPATPIVAIATVSTNNGYYLVDSAGQVFAFGPGA